MDERWSSHDSKSKDVWSQIQKQISLLFEKMNDMYKMQIEDKDKMIDVARNEAKETEQRKQECMKESVWYTNKIVSIALGIPATIAGLIALLFLIQKK